MLLIQRFIYLFILTIGCYRIASVAWTHLNLTAFCACAAEVKCDVINEPHYRSGPSGNDIITNYRHQLPMKYGIIQIPQKYQIN